MDGRGGGAGAGGGLFPGQVEDHLSNGRPVGPAAGQSRQPPAALVRRGPALPGGGTDALVDAALPPRRLGCLSQRHRGRLRASALDRDGAMTTIGSIFAGIAQLVERNLAKVEVAGSIPVSRSISFSPFIPCPTLEIGRAHV